MDSTPLLLDPPSHLAGRLALLAAQAVYLFAPLLVSAALAGLVLRNDWLKALHRPIDGGRSWRGRRVLGAGKTWRGAAISALGCSAFVALQRALQEHVPQAVQVADYASLPLWAFGLSMGIGAILGELPNSFVKRRLGIPSGGTTSGALAALFYVWDQVDTLLGAWPLLCLWLRPSLPLVAMSFVVTLGVHPLLGWIGYRIGARRTAR